MDFKEEVLKLLKKEVKNPVLEIPPSRELGDYAFPCFSLAKEYKKSPNEIAKIISLKLKTNKYIKEIKSSGSYVNFFINTNILAEETLNNILKEGDSYGKSSTGKKKTVVIDISSPNIAKPFGIGHLRSTIIGNSLSKIYSNLGYKVVKINYLGDWGTQFGRLIVGYKKFGSPKELKKNPIKHLLEIYVKANDEKYEQEARDYFKKLEQGDKEVIKLWKLFRDLSIKEFNKIYSLLGIDFDVISGESFYNKKMDNTIKELEKKKLLEKSEGALIVDLEKYNLGICIIQKSDGTTLYTTRDITAAVDRYTKYKFDKMLYEVGSEQKLHFQQVFKILGLLDYKWSSDCVHVVHGLYLDKEGKKFASRKGKVIFMEDILDETIKLAKKTINEKNPKLKNKDKAARKIAIAAIFFGDLKNNRIHNIVFDIEKFLDFEGSTGPYIQYTYARASSILRKARSKKTKLKDLNNYEIALIDKLDLFRETIKSAANQNSPSIIANYTYELAQLFNEFYHKYPVIGSEEQDTRLLIVQATRQVIKNSLNLLGIPVLEEM